MLEDANLEEYMAIFYGYGNYSGDHWFIGKEEGGGETTENNIARIDIWNELGGKEVEDLGYGRKISFAQLMITSAWIIQLS